MKGVLVIEKQSHKKITDLDPLLLLQQKSKFNIDINVRDKNKQTKKKRQKPHKRSLYDHGCQRLFSSVHTTTESL